MFPLLPISVLYDNIDLLERRVKGASSGNRRGAANGAAALADARNPAMVAGFAVWPEGA
jgi:hypothetical protein